MSGTIEPPVTTKYVSMLLEYNSWTMQSQTFEVALATVAEVCMVDIGVCSLAVEHSHTVDAVFVCLFANNSTSARMNK